MRAIVSSVLKDGARSRRSAPAVLPGCRRFALALLLAAGFGASSAADAGAFTLTLAFPDGQPMTYGSACGGLGCLARGDHIETTDERGQVKLPNSVQTIEYRRDGITLAAAPVGVASGTTVSVGDQATVVLPRLLTGSAPGVDADESDLVARLNEARAAQGLPLAQINPRLSAAADLQATWLTQSGVTFAEPGSFHDGPFGTGLAFRHGEVSMPDPVSGGEVAEAGGSAAETVFDWLSSPEHRQQVLAPGQMLVGVAQVGMFRIVQTHKPCTGCDHLGTGTRAGAAPAAPPPAPAPAPPPPPPPPAAVPTVGSSTTRSAPPGCGHETLTTRRLQSRPGSVRLRVSIQCLRRGARYMLLIRQGTAGRTLRSLRVTRAGKLTLALRPGPAVNSLRIKPKRDGRVILVRTASLR
jgi:uncharacterized protein YkwD